MSKDKYIKAETSKGQLHTDSFFPTSKPTSVDELESLMIECRFNQVGNEGWLKTKAKINRFIVESQIKILEKVHRVGRTTAFDNATDEFIDEQIEQLSNNLKEDI